MFQFDYQIRLPKGTLHRGSVVARDEEGAQEMISAIHPDSVIVSLGKACDILAPAAEISDTSIGSGPSIIKRLRANASVPPVNPSVQFLRSTFQVFTIFVGVWQSLSSLNHFRLIWVSLHSQGIGHLYLTIVSLFNSWWLLIAIGLCFLGYGLVADCKNSIGSVVLRFLGGLFVAFVAPKIMVDMHFGLFVWIRSFL
jgi:hypothetical protein